MQVHLALLRGDIEDARDKATCARGWNITSIFVGMLILLVVSLTCGLKFGLYHNS